MDKGKQYYALCLQGEEGGNELALWHMKDDEELGRMMASSVYTSPEGPVQREDLRKREGFTIAPFTPEALLDAVQRNMPTSVFINGMKVAGSVFKGMLKSELGLPIKHPRMIRIDDPEQ